MRKKTGERWKVEDMTKALECVRKDGMSCYKAAKEFGIPEQTLRDRLKGKVADDATAGRPTALTKEEEDEVAATCILFAEWGFGIGKEEVLGVVGEFCKKTKRKVPFINGIPGDDWWRGFLKRHPNLSRRKPQQLQLVRARATTRELVNHWFKDVLEPTLNELGLKNKPKQIYNADESCLPLSGRPDSIICRRGMKSPQHMIAGSGRENITVHCCVSASGQCISPYVVYTGQRLMFDHTQGGPLGTRYGVSPSGWMTGKTFLDWFQSQFVPSLPDARPVLLILDGHASHVSYELRLLAIQHQVHMLKFPSHLTHILQPLDVSVFKPLKAAWCRIVKDFTRREKCMITKKHFPTLLSEACKAGYKPEAAIGGFRKCGIYPYDCTVISEDTYSLSLPYAISESEPTSDNRPATSESRQVNEEVREENEEIEEENEEENEETEEENEEIEEENEMEQEDRETVSITNILAADFQSPDTYSTLTLRRPAMIEEVAVGPILASPAPSLPVPASTTPVASGPPASSAATTPVASGPPASSAATTPVASGPPASSAATTPVASGPPASSATTTPVASGPPASSAATTPVPSGSPASSTATKRKSKQAPVDSPAMSSLRVYFSELLQSKAPKRTGDGRRRRLVGFGESMTSEEALERVQREEEEKLEKEREKERKRLLREEKKRQREAEKNQKKNKRRKRTKKSKEEFYCLVCNDKYDERDEEEWVECESCVRMDSPVVQSHTSRAVPPRTSSGDILVLDMRGRRHSIEKQTVYVKL